MKIGDMVIKALPYPTSPAYGIIIGEITEQDDFHVEVRMDRDDWINHRYIIAWSDGTLTEEGGHELCELPVVEC